MRGFFGFSELVERVVLLMLKKITLVEMGMFRSYKDIHF